MILFSGWTEEQHLFKIGILHYNFHCFEQLNASLRNKQFISKEILLTPNLWMAVYLNILACDWVQPYLYIYQPTVKQAKFVNLA